MALYFVFTQQYSIVFWLLLAAGLCDMFDGMVARILQVHSVLGKELDSLADVVSFGVVPGAIFFQLIRYGLESDFGMGSGIVLAFGGFLYTLGAALRLARFNIDSRQTTGFIGLNTPTATIVSVGAMLIHANGQGMFFEFISNAYFLLGLVILLCILMHAPIKMFGIKSLTAEPNNRVILMAFIVLSILAAIVFKGIAFLLLPFIYVILSFILYRKSS